jgi:MATE family multidrug resistance protein
LIVAAIFQLADGSQVISAGALRGLTDVKVPTVITGIAYWVVALPGAWLLGIWGPWGAVGIWAALALGLGVAAILLITRFVHRSRADQVHSFPYPA